MFRRSNRAQFDLSVVKLLPVRISHSKNIKHTEYEDTVLHDFRVDYSMKVKNNYMFMYANNK